MYLVYTKKAQATRKRILDAAANLMMEKGFGRTKLDEILLKARVRKGNFYYYFKSKEDMGLAVLQEFAAPLTHDWIGGLLGAGEGHGKALLELPDTLPASDRIRNAAGNPVTNLAFELCDLSDDYRKSIANTLMGIQQLYEEELRNLSETGTAKLPARPREVASYVMSLVEGAVMLYRLNRDPAQLKKTLELGLHCIKSQ
jgi:TetR/AcrR family transcriptional repressor of nem operon